MATTSAITEKTVLARDGYRCRIPDCSTLKLWKAFRSRPPQGLCRLRRMAARALRSRNAPTVATIQMPSSPPSRQWVQRPHDRTLYKLRNRIERCFNRLKHFRRLATRYCKRRGAFHATVARASAWLHLKRYVDTA